jgi:hypothetical protein
MMPVKKMLTILLLIVLLFNVAGYRLLITAFENKATEKLEAVISTGDYTESDLVEIKIPLNMPYYSDKDYEAAYGETIYNGKLYRYVKRKITGNTLHLLCIPHQEKNNLVSFKNKLTENMAGNEAENNPVKGPLTSLVKIFQTEFLQDHFHCSFNSLVTGKPVYYISNTWVADFFKAGIPGQPPEQLI